MQTIPGSQTRTVALNNDISNFLKPLFAIFWRLLVELYANYSSLVSCVPNFTMYKKVASLHHFCSLLDTPLDIFLKNSKGLLHTYESIFLFLHRFSFCTKLAFCARITAKEEDTWNAATYTLLHDTCWYHSKAVNKIRHNYESSHCADFVLLCTGRKSW